MRRFMVGGNLIFLPVVDSTNSYAMQLLKNVKPPEGTVVQAGHQTVGRGQRAKVWNSEPGLNLAVSIILYPEFLELQKQAYLYMIAALAAYDTIAEFLEPGQFDIKIKWPNDILLNQKKVCGILIENNLVESKISSTVIGLGINLNQTRFDNLPQASSLKLINGREVLPKDCLGVLMRNIEKHYTCLYEGNYERILKDYTERLFARNCWMDFLYRKESLQCLVLGVGEGGWLQLQKKNGEILTVDAQEIVWVF